MFYILFFSLLVFVIFKSLLKNNSKDEKITFVKSNKREKKRRVNEKRYNDTISKKDREEILVKYNHKCFKCGSEKNLTLDHHMPLSLGYGFRKENIVVLCKKCNNKKGSLLPNDFYTEKEIIVLRDKYRINSHETLKKITKREYSSILNKIKDYEGKEVVFYYLGKVVKGRLLGVVEKKDVELYKTREKYVEVEEDNSINLYRLKGIKELYIDETKRG